MEFILAPFVIWAFIRIIKSPKSDYDKLLSAFEKAGHENKRTADLYK